MAKTPKTGLCDVRGMIRADIPEVLEIERTAFDDGLWGGWGESTVVEHLQTRNCIAMVATVGQVIVGHMFYELHKHHLKLLRLTVDPDCQRRGYGRELMNRLQSKLSTSVAGRHLLLVDVPETNLVAHLFLKACGLRATEVLRNHWMYSPLATYRFTVDRSRQLSLPAEELAER